MQLEKLKSNKKILVYGDVILDHYIYGSINRISPEAPVPVVNIEKEENKLGGAANVHNNLLSLGVDADLISVIGNDLAGDYLKENIKNFTPFIDKSRKTPKKSRVIASNQQLMRIDNEKVEDISDKLQSKILRHIKKSIKNYNILIISDYGKGTLANRNYGFASEITRYARENGVKILIDPHNGIYTDMYLDKKHDLYNYGFCDVMKMNKKQAEMLSYRKITDLESAEKAVADISKDLRCNVIITLSEKGLIVSHKESDSTKIVHYTGKTTEITDVTGAGDTTIAALAWAINLGYTLFEASEIANAAGNIKVKHLGTYGVTVDDLKDYFKPNTKIINNISKINRDDKKVVFVNGCFDVLHPGHLAMLKFAKSQGDILVVGLNSDSSVKMNKGESRPVITEMERAKMLEGFECVDYVIIFNEKTPLDLITKLKPDVHVKGSDHKSETDGVPITLFFNRIEEYSTTKLIG